MRREADGRCSAWAMGAPDPLPPPGCPGPGVYLGERSAGCEVGGGGLSPLGELWGKGTVLLGLIIGLIVLLEAENVAVLRSSPMSRC